MLAIPFQTRLSARVVPWVTLALVAINTLVFLALQRDDEGIARAALKTYAESTLPQLEVPRYRAWLATRTDEFSAERLRRLGPESANTIANSADSAAAVIAIQSHPQFLFELRSGKIVRIEEPAYAQWREDRLKFESQWRISFVERFSLRANTQQPWRLVTYAFVHADAVQWLLNTLVLLLAGGLTETALGRGRFAVAYLLAAAFAGGAHLLAFGTPLVGANGAVAAVIAMVLVLFAARRIPMLLTVGLVSGVTAIPAATVLVPWVASEVLQAWTRPGVATSNYVVHAAGLLSGALLAWMLRPRDGRRLDRTMAGTLNDDPRAERRYSLARQAQEAAARLDTRRAVRLYRELVEGNPDHAGYLAQYFNMALMARDPETLADASLRVLWMRNKGAADELRKVYLQMAQPNVLKTLPVDEQLRLARRLVRTREDAAALKVLDGLLSSDHLRNLYGRQIADCLLGLFTTYTRYGLRQQADNVRTRLKTYFPQPTAIGGLAPNTKPPSTIRGSSDTGGPSTLFIDLSR
jgi:membrane associated rhomboid family serine protease